MRSPWSGYSRSTRRKRIIRRFLVAVLVITISQIALRRAAVGWTYSIALEMTARLPEMKSLSDTMKPPTLPENQSQLNMQVYEFQRQQYAEKYNAAFAPLREHFSPPWFVRLWLWEAGLLNRK